MQRTDAAAYLAGIKQTERAQASEPTNLHVISGTVGEASEDGKVQIAIDGLIFSESDSQYIEVDTMGGLQEGDIATILLSGENGHAMAPLAIGGVGTIDRISGDAKRAKEAADSAQRSATIANRAATDAITQLSFVEDVAGTLQWIQDHGTFVATSDTEVDTNKVYFELTQGEYVPIVLPSESLNPSQQGWYELDTTEAQGDYIMSHLAVTSAGLWVLPSGWGQASSARTAPGYKMLLASDGAYLYDDQGHLVTTYSESITFDSSRPQYIGGENAYIVFYDSDGDGVPDSIRIGGSNVIIGGQRLSEVLSEISTASTRAEAAMDICTIAITSTGGTVFKQNRGVSTTLIVTIFTGDGMRITDATTLHTRFGNGAYLQWKWKDSPEDEFSILVNSDPRIGAGGFTLTVSPSDISTQAIIDCDLIF